MSEIPGNPGDVVRLHGGLISYEVLVPPYHTSTERVVGVRRTELRKEPAGDINGAFAEHAWTGSVPVTVWADIVRSCSRVERARAVSTIPAPKLSG